MTPAAPQNLDAIPAELRELDQWVLWREEHRDGKPTKVPYTAADPDRRASTTDRATWAPFDEAVGAADWLGMGVGFVFTADDPFCGIDLDAGMSASDRGAIMLALDSYAETSVSGNGAHVIVRAALNGGRHPAGFGVFDRARYFVMTGDRIPGTPETIEPRQAQLDDVLAEFLPPVAPAAPQRPVRPVDVGDAELVERMLARRPHLQPLWNGDTSGHGGDHSAADLALARELAYWTGRDPVRVDALFRSSGLMRAKWDERRGDTTYGALTVAKAIAGTPDTYEPRTTSTHRSRCAESAESAERAGPMSPTARAESAESAERSALPRIKRLPRRQTWTTPELEPAAMHGPAGAWAEAVQPYTEASPVGVLVSTLVAFGNAAGRGAYVPVTVTKHYGNEFAILLGLTASGRKGEGMRIGLRPVRLADEAWKTRVQRGFGSGEAIVDAVRDPTVEADAKGAERKIAGADDKRLLVHEDELASVLAVAGRDGSTLSPLIRSAWDGVRLENRTKGRKLIATGAHVSVLGAITPDELVRKVAAAEVANGFLNRFLLVAVQRTKLLPEPKPIPGRLEGEYVAAFEQALAFARREAAGVVELDEQARELWRDAYERELSVDRYGLAGVACSRAEPHTLRLALLYALLDRSATIGVEHLEAALAVWRYCERSAALVFGDRLGDPTADAIVEALRDAADGLTRTELRDLFSRHRSAAELDVALSMLESHGLIVGTPEPTGGRPAIRYRLAGSAAPDDDPAEHDHDGGF